MALEESAGDVEREGVGEVYNLGMSRGVSMLVKAWDPSRSWNSV